MNPSLSAGKLRHQVKLQREQLADDLSGADDMSFVDIATVWASVTASGGREFWDTKKLIPTITHQVEMRYRDGVIAGMRFIVGNVVLRIQAPIDPEGQRIRLLVMCEELVQAVVQ